MNIKELQIETESFLVILRTKYNWEDTWELGGVLGNRVPDGRDIGSNAHNCWYKITAKKKTISPYMGILYDANGILHSDNKGYKNSNLIVKFMIIFLLSDRFGRYSQNIWVIYLFPSIF